MMYCLGLGTSHGWDLSEHKFISLTLVDACLRNGNLVGRKNVQTYHFEELSTSLYYIMHYPSKSWVHLWNPYKVRAITLCRRPGPCLLLVIANSSLTYKNGWLWQCFMPIVFMTLYIILSKARPIRETVIKIICGRVTYIGVSRLDHHWLR